MSHHEKSATAVAERVEPIVVSRVFDAPREDLFRAYTDPAMMAKWFAPEPLTVPRAEIDLRVGGRYTLVMRDTDGNDYTSTGTYLEIVEPERIVYSDSIDEMPSDWVDMINEARGEAKGTPVPDGVVTVTLEDVGGKTKLTFSALYDSKATADAYVKMQMVEGLNGSFDNLERVLRES